MRLFSRRNDPVPDRYSYEIPELVRRRLLITLRVKAEATGRLALRRILHEVEEKLLMKLGALKQPKNRLISPDDAIVEHLCCCDDEEVLDFLEICFQTRGYCGGQPTLDAINDVLREENIGYELTDFHQVWDEDGRSYYVVPPMPVKKEEELLHDEVVKPCLRALGDRRFATALAELMKAFEEYRRGDYGDAVTDAGAAVETVLKTICTHKKWPYDAHKDTCSKLLEICQKNGLFLPFYRPILEATATVRNKIGDAHGKGPAPEFVATKEYADHMIYMVANNISLLVTLAAL